MTLHNPPRPGECIAEGYLGLNDICGRELAAELSASASFGWPTPLGDRFLG